MRFILKNMKREQVLAALAYGFFLACTSVTLWGGYVRFLTGQVDPGSFMLEYFVRSATLPLSLAVSGLAAFYWPKARLWRSPILALGFFLAGSLLVALQHGRRGFVRVVACRGGRVLRMGKRDHVRRLAGNRGCAKGVHGRYRRVCRRWDFGVAVFRC